APPAPAPPAADTQPPSVPANVAAAATDTTLTLTWQTSIDDVGVAGYGVYNGATRVAQTPAPTATLTGLACGTTYTVGVDAYDAAGNRSARSTIGAATSACVPVGGGTASVFVATTGSDSNPCTQPAPCKSLNRADPVPQPGQLAQVAAR